MLTSPKLAFTVSESAELCGVCRDLIYEAIRKGRLQARKVGRRTLIRRCDLEDYLNQLPVLELRGSKRVDAVDAEAQELPAANPDSRFGRCMN